MNTTAHDHEWIPNLARNKSVVSAPVRHIVLVGPDDRSVCIRTDVPFKEAKRNLVEPFERAYVTAVLRRHDMNLSAASRECGLSRKHLRHLARKYDIVRCEALSHRIDSVSRS